MRTDDGVVVDCPFGDLFTGHTPVPVYISLPRCRYLKSKINAVLDRGSDAFAGVPSLFLDPRRRAPSDLSPAVHVPPVVVQSANPPPLREGGGKPGPQ
jgi:hypothetical protein